MRATARASTFRDLAGRADEPPGLGGRMPDQDYRWTLYMSDNDNTARNAVIMADDSFAADRVTEAAREFAQKLGMTLDFDERAFHDVGGSGAPQGKTALYVDDDEHRALGRALELAELWFDVLAEQQPYMGQDAAANKRTLRRLREMVPAS